MSDEPENNSPEQLRPPDKPPRKETLYDMIPLTKKQLDIIIIILVVALLFFIILGALVGNGKT